MNRIFSLLRVQLLALILPMFTASKAQTASVSDTLDVVNWNLEFFGDRPWELPEEMIKTKTIMDNLNADVYALVEVVNADSLNSLVKSLNGNYNYVVSPYGSFAPSPSSSQYADAQKLAFVYRTSMVKNVKARALLQGSVFAYDYWASGRFPFLVTADVLGRDNQWRPFHFVILHAKANSDNSSCNRRYAGAMEMKDTLDTHFSNERLIILGDFNDDLDVSICPSFSESNYAAFVKDSSDNNSYKSLTLALSKAGISSISGYPSFIDHVIVSNEVAPYFVPGSADMLKNKVEQWVTSYTADVSDHYPVHTKYVMDQATTVDKVAAASPVRLYPQPAHDVVFIDQPGNDFAAWQISSADGRLVSSGSLTATGNRIMLNQLTPGTYFIRLTGAEKVFTGTLLIVK